MREFFEIIKKTPLFASIEESDLQSLLGCLSANIVSVSKGGFALMAGDKADHIGIVLEGHMQISREDESGGRAVIASLSPGDFYGEALACANVEQSPVNVSAVVPSKALRIGFQRILTTCPNSCAFHTRLVANMVGIIARKNLTLQRRMEILGKKTIRERLLCYLEGQKKRSAESFEVPFDRAGLAEYLAVDRSALSREIGRLRDEGIISFHKSSFKILREDSSDNGR